MYSEIETETTTRRNKIIRMRVDGSLAWEVGRGLGELAFMLLKKTKPTAAVKKETKDDPQVLAPSNWGKEVSENRRTRFGIQF